MLKYSQPLAGADPGVLAHHNLRADDPPAHSHAGLITRWWDRRDREAQQNLTPQAPATGVVVSWNSGRRNDPMNAGAPRVDPQFRADGPGTRAAS
jgi:hypothetical protein